MTFTQWLIEQTTRSDAVGDFARDAHADQQWPENADLADLRGHLPGALHPVLEEAWAEYRGTT